MVESIPIPDGLDLQGHRGARGLKPENTLPAFRRALELGVTTLELDVVISADRKVVVSHEPWFSELICSHPDGHPVTAAEARRLRLFDMTYDQIRRFDCGMRRHPDFPRQEPERASKPLLSDVIREAEAFTSSRDGRPVQYNIETKSRPSGDGVYHPGPREFTELLYAVLVEHDVEHRSIIQSFDVRTLREAHRIDQDWQTSLLVDRWRGLMLRFRVKKLGFLPSVYSPDFRVVTRSMVQRAHRRNIRVIPWTVNREVDMIRLAASGVDGLITDYPDIAIQALERFLTPTR